MAAEREREPRDGEGPGAERTLPGVFGRLFTKLALAGVGGVILAQEEITEFFRRGDRRPEGAEAEGRASPVAADGEGDPPRRTDWVDVTIDKVLGTLNLPSRAEVDELTRKIDRLAERVAARDDGPAR